jgi:asparaginyl-tRNA synthetase
LTLESTVTIYGIISKLPEGKTAPGGHEMQADYWEVIGKAPGGDEAISNRVNAVHSERPNLHRMQVLIFSSISAISLLEVKPLQTFSR